MTKTKRRRPATRSSVRRILVLHGPNLNLLGMREPAIYGRETLGDIDRRLARLAQAYGVALECFQSNHEGALIERVHDAKAQGFAFIIINPAGYTHTSVAVRDAILASGILTIEVHLSNIYSREEFRQRSLISPVVKGTISGFGPKSYTLGLEALIDLVK